MISHHVCYHVTYVFKWQLLSRVCYRHTSVFPVHKSTIIMHLKSVSGPGDRCSGADRYQDRFDDPSPILFSDLITLKIAFNTVFEACCCCLRVIYVVSTPPVLMVFLYVEKIVSTVGKCGNNQKCFLVVNHGEKHQKPKKTWFLKYLVSNNFPVLNRILWLGTSNPFSWSSSVASTKPLALTRSGHFNEHFKVLFVTRNPLLPTFFSKIEVENIGTRAWQLTFPTEQQQTWPPQPLGMGASDSSERIDIIDRCTI